MKNKWAAVFNLIVVVLIAVNILLTLYIFFIYDKW